MGGGTRGDETARAEVARLNRTGNPLAKGAPNRHGLAEAVVAAPLAIGAPLL